MTHVAAFNFDAINVEELSVRAGELLNISGPPADGWVKCVSVASGKEGFVPESYIKEAPAPVAAAPRRAAPRAPGGGASVPPPAAIGAPASTQVPPPAIGAGSGFPPIGKGMGEQRWSNPSTNSSSLTKRGGAEYEIVRTSIAYDQNLGEWRERERKFQKGELERLPEVKAREYYYWDRNGVRHGPLTETEMKARFDNRQVGSDTLIAPVTTSTGSEALPKMSVNDYFPDSSQTFTTAPIAPIESHTWLYLDDEGKVQGPFDAAQMREWFLDSYFNAETKAKLASRKDIGFVPLSVLFGSEGAEAFLHDGDQLAASQHPQTWPRASGSSRALGGLPPPVNTAVPAAYTPDYFGMNPNPVNTAYPPPAPGYGYTDPFGVQPPAAANPFGSPARSPSSRGLGLTPKAQSGRMLLSLAINGTPPPPAAGSSKNPFEAPDYSTPAQAANDDDWGITWDDEKEEAAGANSKAASADLAVPVPISGGKEEDNRRLASYDRIKQDYLSNSDALIRFLTHALPRELGTVRCKIKRSMNGMLHVNYNVYELYLEMDNGKLGPEILRGVKHKRMGFDSYFDIQVGQVSMSLAETVLATMVMTTLGTQFLLHDNVKSNRKRARDLACVHYLRTGSGGGPRKMTVAIPGFLKNSETDFVEWPHGGSIKKSNLVSAIESLNFKDIQPLMNKPPVWSEKRKAWTLNFHGRVTRASVKNFQLVRPEDHEHIVLQHGRVGQDTFTMDVAWPLSPVQAFAVCISSLHGKLGVE